MDGSHECASHAPKPGRQPSPSPSVDQVDRASVIRAIQRNRPSIIGVDVAGVIQNERPGA